MIDLEENWIKKTLYENGRIYIHDIDRHFNEDNKTSGLIVLSKLYDYLHNNLLSSQFEEFGDTYERCFYPIREEILK